MAFENELKDKLLAWLNDEAKTTSQNILDGCCKSFEEYKERCGRLRALWEAGDALESIDRQLMNPNQEAKHDHSLTS